MIGKMVGQYRLDALLGQGGFGAVYRGVHVHLDTIQAAIKVAHADLARDPEFEKMMRRECEILYGLSHPNIVRFRDLIVEDGVIAVAMELLEGEELADTMERGAMDPDRVPGLLSAMLEGLAYAHDKGVSHRDIKPANVFLCTDGTLKLMDFGIAKAAHSTRATRSGMVSGTVDYMAPERFSGHSSPAADVYAVGLVAWELLVGRPACPDGDMPRKLGWHMGQGAGDVRQEVPGCPDWLAEMIARWCATDPKDRPADAKLALDELGRARVENASVPREPWTAHVAEPGPRPPTAREPAPPTPPRRNRRLLLLPLLAGLAVALVGGTGLLIFLALGPLGTMLRPEPSTDDPTPTVLEPDPAPEQVPDPVQDDPGDPSSPATHPPTTHPTVLGTPSSSPTDEPDEPLEEPTEEDDPLGSLHARLEALQASGDDLTSLDRVSEPIMDQMERDSRTLETSGDLDLAVGAMMLTGHAHNELGGRWLGARCASRDGCEGLEDQNQTRAGDHLEQAREKFLRVERLLESRGVQDERLQEAQSLESELARMLGSLEESRHDESEPDNRHEELAARIPTWEEWIGRLEACENEPTHRLADQLRPVLEEAHGALERQDPDAAGELLSRADELAPRVERRMERCR